MDISVALPVVKSLPDNEKLDVFDTTNLIGVLDILVQMDLALNGYPRLSGNSDTKDSEGQND